MPNKPKVPVTPAVIPKIPKEFPNLAVFLVSKSSNTENTRDS